MPTSLALPRASAPRRPLPRIRNWLLIGFVAALILSTIHSIKGQEWKAVYVLNVLNGCMPSDLGTGAAAELEEERRLLYVAMTPAKDELHVISPQRFYVTGQTRGGDRHVYANRARLIILVWGGEPLGSGATSLQSGRAPAIRNGP